MEALWRRGGVAPQSGYISWQGLSIHYVALGQGNPVVLVHGAGLGCAKWYSTLAPLAQHGQVLAPDLPGFGLSARPRLRGQPQEIAASFLEGFLDALELRQASLVGSSLGGFAVLSFALRHPRRVERLVVMDSLGLGRELPWAFRLMAVPGLCHLLTRPSRVLARAVFRRLIVYHPDHPDAELLIDYLYRVSASPGYAAAFRYGAPMFLSLWGQRAIFSGGQLRSLSLPTLILWGQHDRFFPLSHAQRAAGLIPGAQIRVIPDAGHAVSWDRPEAVNSALIDFLFPQEEKQKVMLKGGSNERSPGRD